jgi:membrane fusion protein (multidrug efflux system)
VNITANDRYDQSKDNPMSDAEGYEALGDAEAEAAQKQRRTSWLNRYRLPLMIGGPVLLIGIAGFFILTGGKAQATDDAYVQIAKAPVASSVSGRVVEVMVKENQLVKKGDPLFRLDPRDFNAAADQASAQLYSTYGQVLALKATYAESTAAVGQVQTRVTKAQDTAAFTAKEADRQKAMYEAGVGSRDQYDQAAHAAQTARSDLATSQSDLAAAKARQQAALAQSGNLMNPAPEQHPLVLAAKANLEKAKINQSYGLVTAPADGIVTKVDQIQPGAYVSAAQTAFWLLAGKPWVEANFKEDQLAKMKIGQPAVIKVDAYGEKLEGHVASFSPGTGQAFSALPAQNATGNWVKVTQRLPVRIEFDKLPPEMAGRSGLSAHVKVDTTGPGSASGKAAG